MKNISNSRLTDGMKREDPSLKSQLRNEDESIHI